MIPHSKPELGAEERAAVDCVLASGMLAQGREVEAFEAECAACIGRRYAVAVSSGAAALHLALIGLDLAPRAGVAMPSYACAALAHAAFWVRATPLLCDIGVDYNLDAPAVPPTAHAVILPHLFGAPAVAPAHGEIIEDLAQAFGAEGTGRIGRVSIASFYATKLFTTGEGGMLLCDDEALAERARDLRDYDNRDDFRVRYAYKMTDFQAALGRVQLQRLPGFIARRREIAARYSQAFSRLPLRLPSPTPGHVYFRYVVATPERDLLQAWLAERGVEAKRPVHLPLHHYLGGNFPASERAHQECLSIPIYPALTTQESELVIDSVRRYFG